MQWRPKPRADRDMSSVAGDTSEGSTSAPRLGSIDELDEEALKEMRDRVTQTLARKKLEKHDLTTQNCKKRQQNAQIRTPKPSCELPTGTNLRFGAH